MYLKNFILLVFANLVCAAIMMLGAYRDNSHIIETETVLEDISSVKRTIPAMELENAKEDEPAYAYIIDVSGEDIETLMKIVEAEAGGEDYSGKLLVADVVINRVRSNSFPDNVTDVVYQKTENTTQFSPVSNGRINSVTISSDTKEAVYNALMGEDISKGALYFMARKYSQPQSVMWFDNNLNFLFTYGNHDFFS